MKFLQKKAFTLIELLVSITIFFVLVTMTYVPYNFYMNKVKVRNTIKEISQSLYEARNMAINGISNGSNKSIGLYIDVNNDDTLTFFSYPFSFTGSQITNQISSDVEFVKSYTLLKGMKIRSINSEENGLFFFDAITGKGKYFYWDTLGNRQDITDNEIEIDFSYGTATPGTPLFGELRYFTKTYIVDY